MTGLKPEYYDKQVYYTISPLGDFYITVAHIGNQYVRLRKRSVAFRIRIEVRQWQDTDGDGTNDTEVLLNGYNLDKQINYTQRVDTYNY